MGERSDLLEALAEKRYFLRNTTAGMTDEQCRLRTTVSELTLGGLIKHVAATEGQWAKFIVEGTSAMSGGKPFEEWDESDYSEHSKSFQLLESETLAGALDVYEKVAASTDELVGSLPDLAVAHELPPAPWFEPGKSWSARRVFVHIVGETAHHAGHADIIRESIDGQKSMG